jgi:hypothetical protein
MKLDIKALLGTLRFIEPMATRDRDHMSSPPDAAFLREVHQQQLPKSLRSNIEKELDRDILSAIWRPVSGTRSCGRLMTTSASLLQHALSYMAPSTLQCSAH